MLKGTMILVAYQIIKHATTRYVYRVPFHLTEAIMSFSYINIL
jgi:hypothetical protein